MKTDVELNLLKEIDALKRKLSVLKESDSPSIPTYQYSKIRESDLKTLFDIEKKLSTNKFDAWFNNKINLNSVTIDFLQNLIEQNRGLIDDYNEEDLKIYLISPLLNRINFILKDKEIRGFYELPMRYSTEKFILNGTVDFVISKGLFQSKKPYFFIQEFKRSEEYGNPRPQLLAELISAIELNHWNYIKGAYVIGGNWHFVILEKLKTAKYHYFISENFDATKIDDLILIYKNLVFIKNEIINERGSST
ncbi:MAG: hypothetical protein Q9M50_08140 [Methylococcales bacterium]|nr:hypothetical protein [Methylococcales bacterium]